MSIDVYIPETERFDAFQTQLFEKHKKKMLLPELIITYPQTIEMGIDPVYALHDFVGERMKEVDPEDESGASYELVERFSEGAYVLAKHLVNSKMNIFDLDVSVVDPSTRRPTEDFVRCRSHPSGEFMLELPHGYLRGVFTPSSSEHYRRVVDADLQSVI